MSALFLNGTGECLQIFLLGFFFFNFLATKIVEKTSWRHLRFRETQKGMKTLNSVNYSN